MFFFDIANFFFDSIFTTFTITLSNQLNQSIKNPLTTILKLGYLLNRAFCIIAKHSCHHLIVAMYKLFALQPT